MSHRPILGSASIDSLFWCLHAEQIGLFLGLYERLWRHNRKAAAMMLRTYRKRRPWLNLRVNHRDGFYDYRLPGGCGAMGRLKQRFYVRHNILYGVMNLIREIKARQDPSSTWDFWGWHDRRKVERLSEDSMIGAMLIAASLTGISRADAMQDIGLDDKWMAENPRAAAIMGVAA